MDHFGPLRLDLQGLKVLKESEQVLSWAMRVVRTLMLGPHLFASVQNQASQAKISPGNFLKSHIC